MHVLVLTRRPSLAEALSLLAESWDVESADRLPAGPTSVDVVVADAADTAAGLVIARMLRERRPQLPVVVLGDDHEHTADALVVERSVTISEIRAAVLEATGGDPSPAEDAPDEVVAGAADWRGDLAIDLRRLERRIDLDPPPVAPRPPPEHDPPPPGGPHGLPPARRRHPPRTAGWGGTDPPLFEGRPNGHRPPGGTARFPRYDDAPGYAHVEGAEPPDPAQALPRREVILPPQDDEHVGLDALVAHDRAPDRPAILVVEPGQPVLRAAAGDLEGLDAAQRAAWPTRRTTTQRPHALHDRVEAAAEVIADLPRLLDALPTLRSSHRAATAFLAEVVHALDPRTAAVWRRREHRFRVLAHVGLSDAEAAASVPVDHPLLRSVVDHHRGVLITPTDLARGYLAGLGGTWPDALLAVPVGDGPLAPTVVLVGGTGFEEQDLRLLLGLAHEAAAPLTLAAMLQDALVQPAADEPVAREHARESEPADS